MKKRHTIRRMGTLRLIALFLALLLLTGLGPTSASAAQAEAHFADVPSTHWHTSM